MAKRKPLTNVDGEVREMTAEDAITARSFSALPQAEQEMLLSLRRRGGPKALSLANHESANRKSGA